MTIWVHQWPSTPQLDEARIALVSGLKALGHTVSLEGGNRQIMIGANAARGKLLPGATVWNLEQAGSFHFSPEYVEFLKKCTVWDYNYRNAELTRRLYGIESKVVPIGWVPEFEIIIHDVNNLLYDICFFGALNARRREILSQMCGLGLRVVNSSHAYGERRDLIMSQSKIVLNMHFHDQKIMESFRMMRAMSNHKCVLTQCDPDTRKDDLLAEGALCCSYDRLAQTALILSQDAGLREYYEKIGYQAVRQRPMAAQLAAALEWRAPPSVFNTTPSRMPPVRAMAEGPRPRRVLDPKSGSWIPNLGFTC